MRKYIVYLHIQHTEPRRGNKDNDSVSDSIEQVKLGLWSHLSLSPSFTHHVTGSSVNRWERHMLLLCNNNKYIVAVGMFGIQSTNKLIITIICSDSFQLLELNSLFTPPPRISPSSPMRRFKSQRRSHTKYRLTSLRLLYWWASMRKMKITINKYNRMDLLSI